MPDIFSKEIRSWVMSRIRKTDSRPELLVRRHLYHQGFRYRLYKRDLPGNPDIVLGHYRQMIFVNGCFWHAHEGCKLNRMPKSREDYWAPKIARTVARDIRNQEQIQSMGWNL